MSESLAEQVYEEFHPSAPEKRFEEPVWFGLTVFGDWKLCYAVKAHSESEAATRLAEEAFHASNEDTAFFMPQLHRQKFQEALDKRYQDKDIVRVIPFSTEPYPERGQAELTSAQIEAFEKFRPGLSKTWVK
jgi:hypothetical protein